MSRRGQAGMAVVVAILLVALAASTAALMLSQQDLWTRQVESMSARTQADAVARAGLEWARRALVDALKEPDPDAARDAALSGFANGLLRDVALDITYADPQALFNLNNVVRADRLSEPDVQVFGRLLVGAGLNPELANAVVDAIDGDSETSLPGGAEDLDYLAMDPPRRAANRPLTDPGHLARVKGYTPEAVARLRQFVSALPGPTAINVATAPAGILMAIVNGLDIDAAQRLVESREKTPFSSPEAFRTRLPEQATLLPGVAIAVASKYVLVVSRARFGGAEVAYQALVGRPGAAQTGVIWRRQGED